MSHWILGGPFLRDTRIGMHRGGFHRFGYLQMDGLEWRIQLKWIIWGYPHSWNPPYRIYVVSFQVGRFSQQNLTQSGDCCERLTHDWQIAEPSRAILDLMSLKEDVPGQGMMAFIKELWEH